MNKKWRVIKMVDELNRVHTNHYTVGFIIVSLLPNTSSGKEIWPYLGITDTGRYIILRDEEIELIVDNKKLLEELIDNNE